MPTPDFKTWMTQIQAAVEQGLNDHLPSDHQLPHRLHTAMRYAALGGGKRVRPLLVFAAGELTTAPEKTLGIVACAIEMIHVYSLVHDDLPCMDNDVLRRGRPTCHIAFDEPTALLVGDSLLPRAFECLSGVLDLPHHKQIQLIHQLAKAAGSCGMAGGQALDLAAVGITLNQPELELMHALKTGALIHASVLMGALCGSALSPTEEKQLNQFAHRAGLLFQVVDDILDCTATTDTLGKTAGKDAASEKPTYVQLLGLSEARRYAETLRTETLSYLNAFGHRAQRMIQLTHFICDRTF